MVADPNWGAVETAKEESFSASDAESEMAVSSPSLTEIVCPDAGKLLGTGGSFTGVMVMVMDAGLLVSEPSLAVY